ncbi:hypothetical protein SAMN03159341_109103 [Paenibacillus sp. 1_12]|nr:hypothetical protein SAMN03159341_109103 [Paenibacillus sp. 1_12]
MGLIWEHLLTGLSAAFNQTDDENSANAAASVLQSQISALVKWVPTIR